MCICLLFLLIHISLLPCHPHQLCPTDFLLSESINYLHCFLFTHSSLGKALFPSLLVPEELLLGWLQFSSVQFSCSVVSDSLRPHESQHAQPPCPSPTPGVYSNSCPSSRWCHPAISSSVIPFSSCPQSLPASGSFPTSQLCWKAVPTDRSWVHICRAGAVFFSVVLLGVVWEE